MRKLERRNSYDYRNKLYKPLLNDIVFKYIFGNSKNIRFTEYLLELIFNLEIGSLKDKVEIINSFTLEKTSFIERGLEIDIRVKMPNNEYIDLEAYTSFSMTSRLKSMMYLAHMFATQLDMGENINNAKPHMQINFVKGIDIKSKTYNIISEDESREYFIGNYFQIRVINVDEAKNMKYNKTNRLTRMLRFMSAETLDEEKEIVKGDEILEEIAKEKSKFLQSEWASNFFTNINYLKSVHNAEMQEKDDIIQEKNNMIHAKDDIIQNTIKSLYNDGVSVSKIASFTNLSINDVEKIINKK